MRSEFVWLFLIVGGFFLCGIMFSRMIPKLVLGKDICKIGADHNPGAANVFSSCGVVVGLICLFFDMLKGFLPVYLALRMTDIHNLLFAAVLVAPVFGHAIAPFNHFHGGKCIATAFGEMAALLPVTRVGFVLAGLYILFSTVVKINPIRICSILTFGLFACVSGIWLWINGYAAVSLGCILISLIAILRHTKWFSVVEESENVSGNENDDEDMTVKNDM